MSNVSQWSTTAGSNNSAPPNGWPEGMAPSAVNDAARENMAALAKWYKDTNGSLTSGGSSNAYTLTTNNAHAALADQSFIVFKANHANTGAATLNVDTLGAKAIEASGAALVGGEIAENAIVAVIYNATDDVYELISAAFLKKGKHTLPVPASAMYARSTSGAASGSSETSSNKVMVQTFDFDAASDEFVQFQLPMPKSWNEGTITAEFLWSHPSTTTNFDVVWGIQGLAVGNDDALDAAFGTAQTVTDTGGTTDDLYITAATSAVTIAGTPAAGDMVIFQVYRDADNGSDTLAVDARLHGVRIYLTLDAADDS